MPPRGENLDVNQLLAVMDMPVGCPGLVAADEETLWAKQREADPPLEEIVALERAREFGASYVYFRRPEGRAIPMVYVYDWTERLEDARRSRSKPESALPKAPSAKLGELHRRVWSAGEVPLVQVFLPTEVQVFHVLQGPGADKDGEPEPNAWRTIQRAAGVAKELQKLKELSARRLDDGRFWEEYPGARELKLEGAAFMALSRQLGECRRQISSKSKLEEPMVKRLLILFMLIKYLEERTDREGRGAFPEGTFAQFARGAKGFVDLVHAGGEVVLGFFDHLAERARFNGDVFQLDKADKKALKNADMGPFADFLEGHTEGTQRTFWRRYAFNDLPVELISHLYEQFLPRQPGVVYTPPLLVNFILDQVLPLSQKTPPSFRLLDPACGSGVFLVGAFKRLVHRRRRENDFRRPGVEDLKRLVRDHLVGVDLEGEAVRLTLFSLSVALCDFLDPRIIWDELHFDPLIGSNLIEKDFFLKVTEGCWEGAKGFDLIVGNPPFVSELTDAGKVVLKEIKKEEPAQGKKPGFKLPDNQAALLFLKAATRIAKPGAVIALVQPSGPLLYGETSHPFRESFLSKVHVPMIVDFTHLSRVLFKRQPTAGESDSEEENNPSNRGDVAVAVVFAEKRPPDDSPLLHVTVRRTVQAERKLLFEIDHYDLHFVPRTDARSDPGPWKANFIGGGRIAYLLRRLGRLPSLGEFLEDRRKEGWVYGEGFIAGDKEKIERLEELVGRPEHELSDKERAEMEALKKRHRQGPWLTGRRPLPTKAFTSKGVAEDRDKPISQSWFAEPRHKTLFAGPLLLVKRLIEANSKKVPIALLNEGVVFKDRIFGVHAPRAKLAQLERIRLALMSDLARFHLLATSSEYLINRSSALRQEDIIKLPFPDSPEGIELSPVETILMDDVLDYVADFKRKGEDASVLKCPDNQQLEQFREVFCKVLGSVYKTLRSLPPVHVAGGICAPFYFGEAPSHRIEPGAEGETKLEELLTAQVGSSLRCQRVLRVFTGNMLLLVKPPQLRYWLRSIAVRDADELFAELQEQGY